MQIENLISLQFKTKSNFNDNLNKLLSLLKSTPTNSLILAPEVSLTDFCYDKFKLASEFSKVAIEKITPLTKDRVFAITLIQKREDKFFNTLVVFQNEKIIYTQDKYKLFPLGDEILHFEAGKEESIRIFQVGEIKIASLICFEVRFPTLWEVVKGADIILVPAMWGEPRKDNFETLTKALAIANQCYVVASNSKNDDMAKSSAIISPFGRVNKNDNLNIIKSDFKKDEIRKMRKYIRIGLG